MASFSLLFFILTVLFSLGSTQLVETTTANPFADAEEKLNDLKSLIQGKIAQSQLDVNSAYNYFQNYSSNTADAGKKDLDTQNKTIYDQLEQLQLKAENSTLDATVCFNGVETLLLIQQSAYSSVDKAVADSHGDAGLIVQQSSYLADVVYNIVTGIELKFQLCSDVNCAQSIIEQVGVETGQLPKLVDVVTSDAQSSFATLRIATSDSITYGVRAFVVSSNALVSSISDCVKTVTGN